MNTPPDDQTNRRILVIDDNRDIHNYFREILMGGQSVSQWSPRIRAWKASSYCAKRSKKASRMLFAFVDMPDVAGIDGIETITKLWELDADLQVVICTGTPTAVGTS